MAKRLLSVLMMVFCVAYATTGPARAQTPAPIVVRAAPAGIEIGLDVTVDIAIEVVDVEALYGFDVALQFDPQVVEVADVDAQQDGAQVALGTFLEPGFVVLNQVDNAAGTLHFAMTQLNPAKPKSGTGTLIVVRLRGKAVGTSPIKLTNAQLARGDGALLATQTVNGEVRVVAQASAGPTNTPIPSQGAGTPMPVEGTPAPAGVTRTPRATPAPPPQATTTNSNAGLPDWLFPVLGTAGLAVVAGLAMYLGRRQEKST